MKQFQPTDVNLNINVMNVTYSLTIHKQQELRRQLMVKNLHTMQRDLRVLFGLITICATIALKNEQMLILINHHQITKMLTLTKVRLYHPERSKRR